MKRTSMMVLIAVLVAGVGVGTGVAGALSAARGVVAGRVMECAPGPVVAGPLPKPQPIVITLYFNHKAYRRERVALPVNLPWTGTFRFSVVPGRYDVVSSYQHHSSWVTVRAGAQVAVNFTTGACPL